MKALREIYEILDGIAKQTGATFEQVVEVARRQGIFKVDLLVKKVRK